MLQLCTLNVNIKFIGIYFSNITFSDAVAIDGKMQHRRRQSRQAFDAQLTAATYSGRPLHHH